MNIAASLTGLLACLRGPETGAGRPVLACNANAITAAERPRYRELLTKLRLATRARRELPDGYAFRLMEKSISLADVAEWIRMERLCCPFLVFHLELAGSAEEMELVLRGPSGTKAILESVFSNGG
ncbi:MAG: hypothetical protein ACK5AZ_17980 [Bryobacteraceae bacterium]